MCDADERDLQHRLQNAKRHKAHMDNEYMAMTTRYHEAQQAAADAEHALADYPRKKYWSRLSTVRLPMEVVWLIVSKSAELVWKCYTSPVASMKLMIDPRHLQLMHVKFLFQRPQTKAFTAEFRNWHEANQKIVDYPWPTVKWKRRVEGSSVKGLLEALQKRPVVWTLGATRMTFFGPEALITVTGLISRRPPLRFIARINRNSAVTFHHNAETNTLRVPYVDLNPTLKAVYGGQPKRVIVTYK